jgi:hypothetical protein
MEISQAVAMKNWILFGVIAFVLYQFIAPNRVELGPGVMAPETPEQFDATSNESFQLNDYTVTPLANFEITAKVLAKKRYRTGREADLSPYDLALGWGRMSDESVIENIKISQSGRWYRWKTNNLPIPRREIETSSANMHMIPANEYIEQTLSEVSEGQVISLKGYLVRVAANDGWKWKSSMTRTDTGGGACELIYVESFEIL